MLLEHTKQNGARDRRHHIAHLHVVHPDDIPRFKELDVIANFQALYYAEDSYMTELNYPFLGRSGWNGSTPIGRLPVAVDALLFGNGWDVQYMDPSMPFRWQSAGGVTVLPGSLDTAAPGRCPNRGGWLYQRGRTLPLETKNGTLACRQAGTGPDYIGQEHFPVSPGSNFIKPGFVTLFRGKVVYGGF